MKNPRTTLIGGLVALAVGGSALLVPKATADTTTQHLDIPLACNLQLKNPNFLTSSAQGVYNSGEDRYSAFKIAADVTAPKTVTPGEKFTYTIDFGSLKFPAEIKAAVTANVSKASQLNLWVDLPTNATLESVETTGGDSAVKVEQSGGRLRFYGQGGKDVTAWSKANRNAWQHGGLEATKSGGSFSVNSPKVELTFKAPNQPGEKIAPKFDGSDPNSFSPRSFLQLFGSASALGFKVDAFIRCGLSENHSGAKATKPATPFPSVEVVALKPPAPTTAAPTSAAPTTETTATAAPTTAAPTTETTATAAPTTAAPTTETTATAAPTTAAPTTETTATAAPTTAAPTTTETPQPEPPVNLSSQVSLSATSIFVTLQIVALRAVVHILTGLGLILPLKPVVDPLIEKVNEYLKGLL